LENLQIGDSSCLEEGLIVLNNPEKKVLSLTGSDEEEIASFAILLHSSLKAKIWLLLGKVSKEWSGAVE
jgi:hypothetical protein